MSSQSDILSPEDQCFLFNDLGIEPYVVTDMNFFTEEPTCNSSEYVAQEDFKQEIIAFPPVLKNVPSNEEYLGPYEFEVDIHPNGSKNAWVYSSCLNKVYMNMRSPFPVDFKVTVRPDCHLFIRVTPVYSAPKYAQDSVHRCLNHEFATEKSENGLDSSVRQHIIKCTNPLAKYQGDKYKNERLSIVIPFSFPQTGTDNVREMFEFLCKNSCPTPGMNRRAIEIIFTLEDVQGNILGRQMLNVRVCSCPKRDKEKDEKEYNSGKLEPPQGKKRKLVKTAKKIPMIDNDCREYSVTINLPGKHNIEQLLKYCHDLMAGEIVKRANTGTEGPFQKCLNNINSLMREPLE